MPSKIARRQRIRELLARRQLYSQEQLQELLDKAGVEVTQATLSRDLRDLGVSKGPAGYQLPPSAGSVGIGSGTIGSLASGSAIAVAPPAAPRAVHSSRMTRELERMLASQLLAVHAAGNLAVLRTMPGHASPLAIEIDRSQLPGVMGTIAGDDTVFVAAKSAGEVRKLLKTFRTMAGQ